MRTGVKVAILIGFALTPVAALFAQSIYLKNATLNRLKEIRAKVPKNGKRVSIPIPQLVQPLTFTLKGPGTLEISSKDIPLVGRPSFVARLSWLRSLEEPTSIKGESSASAKIPEGTSAFFVQRWNIDAIEFTDGHGNKKYYAERISSGLELSSTANSHQNATPMVGSKSKIERADIVNAEDVDWMFGVNDYTKIQTP